VVFSLKVVAIIGHKKSGKTRLAAMLIKSLRDMGYKVASAKHVHHADFSIDQVGKDSWIHGEAGANPNIIISPREVAIIWRDKNINSIDELLNLVAGEADFLILEGFYNLVRQYKEVLRVVLVKNKGDLDNLRGDIVATFEEIDCSEILKLPQQFSKLLKNILSFKER
jgi:molybdopterin-guanine dinucleotide biosynthesis protein B